MTTIVKTRRATLKALSLHMSKDPLRPAMNGVYIDSDGSMCATDGHTALYVPPNGLTVPVNEWTIIPSDTVKNLCKGGKRRMDDFVIIDRDGGKCTATVMTESGDMTETHHFEPVFDTFPNFRLVFPSEVSDEPASYNPDLLARFERAFELIVGENFYRYDRYYVLRQNGRRAAVAYPAEGSEFIGIVMPRLSGDVGVYNDSLPIPIPAQIESKPEPDTLTDSEQELLDSLTDAIPGDDTLPPVYA